MLLKILTLGTTYSIIILFYKINDSCFSPCKIKIQKFCDEDINSSKISDFKEFYVRNVDFCGLSKFEDWEMLSGILMTDIGQSKDIY